MKKIINIVIIFALLYSSIIIINAQSLNSIIEEYEPQYNYIGNFYNGYSYINDSGKYNVISTNNNKILDNDYMYISDYFDDVFLTIKNHDSNIEYIDKTNKVVLSLEANIIGDNFYNNIALIYNLVNGSIGVISKQGDIILNCEYSKIVISGKNIYVTKNDKWRLYICEADNFIDVSYKVIYSDNINVIISENNKNGIVDFNGNLLTDIKYDKISKNINGYYQCYFDKYLDIIDESGNFIVQFQINNILDNITEISDEMICINNIYYNMDKSIYLELPELCTGEAFYEGYAVVKNYPQSQGDTYINKSGERATEKSWSKAYRFAKGYALVMDYIYDEYGKAISKQWYIINSDFEIIKELDNDIYYDFSIDNSYDFSNNYIRTIDKNTGKMGYIYINEITMKNVHNPIINKYYITFNPNGGIGNMSPLGDITVGTKITLPSCAFVKEGYTFSHWTDGTNNYQAGDTYIMPDYDVTMSAVWKKDIVIPPIPDDKDKDDKNNNRNSTISFINIIIAQNQAIIMDDTTQPTETKYVCPYKDISGHWGEDIIKYIAEYGLMDGITETQFKPDAPMTREVFFIAMARLAGITENHIDWAKSNGILMGYGNGEYGLQDTITREQMAVIFKRFLDKMEIDLTDYKTVTKKQFADHGSISSWAVDSVYEIQEIGLVKGKSNNMFDPLGNTTRAEGATVLYNLIQTIIEKIQ